MAVETVYTDTSPSAVGGLSPVFNIVSMISGDELASFAAARAGTFPDAPGSDYTIYGSDEGTFPEGTQIHTIMTDNAGGEGGWFFQRLAMIFNTADAAALAAITSIDLKFDEHSTSQAATLYLGLMNPTTGLYTNPTDTRLGYNDFTDITLGGYYGSVSMLGSAGERTLTLNAAAITLVTNAIAAGKNIGFMLLVEEDANNTTQESLEPKIVSSTDSSTSTLRLEITYQAAPTALPTKASATVNFEDNTIADTDQPSAEIPSLDKELSFDGGQTWVASEYDSAGKIKPSSGELRDLFNCKLGIMWRYVNWPTVTGYTDPPTCPPQPAAIFFECSGTYDQQLMNSTTAMEYSIDDEATWSDVTEADMDFSAIDLTGVEFIYVRFKESAGMPVGPSLKVSRCGFDPDELPTAPANGTITIDTVAASGEILTYSITTAGTDYARGLYEPVNADGGNGLFSVFEVTSIDGSGGITGLKMHIGGFLYEAGDVLTFPQPSSTG